MYSKLYQLRKMCKTQLCIKLGSVLTMNEKQLLIYLKMALQIHQETNNILLKNMKLKRKEIHKIKFYKEQLREELKLKVRRYGS